MGEGRSNYKEKVQAVNNNPHWIIIGLSIWQKGYNTEILGLCIQGLCRFQTDLIHLHHITTTGLWLHGLMSMGIEPLAMPPKRCLALAKSMPFRKPRQGAYERSPLGSKSACSQCRGKGRNKDTTLSGGESQPGQSAKTKGCPDGLVGVSRAYDDQKM